MTSILILGSVLLLGLVVAKVVDAYGNAFLGEAIAAINAGPLAIASPVTIHLAQSPFTAGPGVTLASITEATFDGYAAKTITGYTSTVFEADQTAQVLGNDVLSWTPSGSMTPNTIGGWVAVDHAGNMVNNGAIIPAVLLSGPSTALSMVWGYGIRPGNTTATILP